MKVLKSIVAIVVIGALAAVAYIIFSRAEGPSSQTQENTIVINEYMAANRSFLPDDKGQYSDWIEIYNPLDTTVDLSGYGLSNDKKSAKWNFPGLMLNSKGFIVVFASGAGTSDTSAPFQHANFKISADKGGIYLFNREGAIVDSEEYNTTQIPDVSLGRTAADFSKWDRFTNPTPGFINDDSGYEAFRQSRIAKDTELLITEVMSANKTAFTDNNGKYSDYIEIYNKSDKAIDLTGYGLSDDPSKVLNWKFPAVTIEPGKYLIIFASGEDKASTDLSKGAIHTDFKISAYKQTLVLSDNMGYILDQVDTPDLAEDIAYVRVMNAQSYTGTWEKGKPTPGAANDAQG